MFDSLAVFRNRLGPDLNALAEKHLQHDLQQSDRDALQNAANTVSTAASTGSFIGLSLGLLLAFRLRRTGPGRFGNIITGSLLAAGGLFCGGETGLLVGTLRARSHISADPGSHNRIHTAFRRFRADALREQADLLDRSEGAEESDTWVI